MVWIQLRPAVFEDAEIVFKWRKIPFIVAHSSSQRIVKWEEHLKWFEETINGSRRKMFIVQKGDQSVGQLRFDKLNKKICIISVYLLQEFTGKTYGVEAIRYGSLEIFKFWNVQKVIACVRSDNIAAVSAFMKVGFVKESLEDYCPESHFVLSLSRSKFASKGDKKVQRP